MDKRIVLPEKPVPTKCVAPKKKKVITSSDQWGTISRHLDVESQKKLLLDIVESREKTELHHALLNALKIKHAGYKSQDIAKSLFDEEKFVRFEDIVSSLVQSELQCFYCRKSVKLFYEYVRDPLQWSLERIDNKYGHNTDNVEIACLECNLRRKTMYHERYLYTKQVVVQKI